MERFFFCVDRMVAEGVAVYIELLCSGEQRRSKQLLHDLMQVSSLAAGGPSSKLGSPGCAAASVKPFAGGESKDDDAPPRGATTDRMAKPAGPDTPGRSIAWALIYFTLRSILSSLLVLRATGYWTRIPRLESFQACCRVVADIVEDVREGVPRELCERCEEDGSSGCRCETDRNPGPAQSTPDQSSLAVAETH